MRESERRADVVLLGDKRLQAGARAAGLLLFVGLFSHLKEVVDVTPADSLPLIGGRQPIGGVIAKHLEHSVAGYSGVRRVAHHQRLRDKLAEHVADRIDR